MPNLAYTRIKAIRKRTCHPNPLDSDPRRSFDPFGPPVMTWLCAKTQGLTARMSGTSQIAKSFQSQVSPFVTGLDVPDQDDMKALSHTARRCSFCIMLSPLPSRSSVASCVIISFRCRRFLVMSLVSNHFGFICRDSNAHIDFLPNADGPFHGLHQSGRRGCASVTFRTHFNPVARVLI